MKKVVVCIIVFLLGAKTSQAQFDTNFHFGDSIKKAEATSDVKEKVRILRHS